MKIAERVRREMIMGIAPRMLYRIDIDRENKKKLKTVADLLSKREDLSAVWYFNHAAYGDPIVAAHMAMIADRKRTRHILVPASFSHSDPEKPKSEGLMWAINQGRKSGIEIVRLIQAYQVNNTEFGYTSEQAKATYKMWLERLHQLGNKKNIPTICIISPEGHRSETGRLQEAEEAGTKALGNNLYPLVFVPVGLEYSKGFNRNAMNFGKRARVTIGEIFIQEARKDWPGIEKLMNNLGLALPPEMRGPYGGL